VRFLLFLLARRQVSGRENIPAEGPLLVVSNHLGLADPPLLNSVFDRQVRFMAKKNLFRFKPIGNFISGLGAFPVHRGRPDVTAFRQAERILAQGLALIVFPEGTRSRNGKLRQAFPGPAFIALRSGAPILPIGVTGTEKFERPPWILRYPRITVNIGRPFYLPPGANELSKTELTRVMMEHIAELLPPEYQGMYAKQGK
jgi:1-acyl-sn-glycerol-3-phosphate acyltransferase